MSLSLPMYQAIAVETPSGEEDLELVARAMVEPREFALLYGRYLDPVHQYCYRRLGTREAAEDATSQVFLKALTALPRFSMGQGSFRSWLFTIAHNVVVDSYRSTKPADVLDQAYEVAAKDPSPEDLAVAADAGRSLRQAMAHLPERQRQVVELRLAGLSGREIGAVLGCRPRSVDVAQFRAVSRLRELMGVGTEHREDHDV